MPRKERLLIVTAVWGEWHIAKFLEVNLPTLFAPGNFPALAELCDVSYLIYTHRADMARLKGSNAIQALSTLMRVNFRTIPARAVRSPIEAHHVYWSAAIAQATKEKSHILLMPPDVAWSDGSFRHVGGLIADGKQAIFMTYLRAESESFTRAIQTWRLPGAAAISISGAELVKLSLKSLHPLMAAYDRSSANFPIHPEMILWAVRNEGVLCRMLAREMFVYDPRKVRLTKENLAESIIDPAAMEVIRDSDDLFAVSLAPFEKESEWYAERGAADLDEVGDWWLDYDSWINDYVAGAKLRWHFRPVTERLWRNREQGADVFLRRAAAAREGRRIWRAARSLACTAAAHLLAVAIQTGCIARAIRGRGGALVFLPNDGAFAALANSNSVYLHSIEGERDSLRLMRKHFVPNIDPVNAIPIEQRLGSSVTLDLEAADGTRLTVERRGTHLSVNGIAIVGSPLNSGKNQVYVIDGLLGHVPKSALHAAETTEAL